MKAKFILCALLIFFSNGCAKEKELSIKKREDIVEISRHAEKKLNWMGHWLGEYGRETLVNEVCQDFELMNPDIKVNLKYPFQIMGLRNRWEVGKYIADMLETGNIQWDVIWMDDVIYQFAAERLGDPKWGEKNLVNFKNIKGFGETQKSFIIDDPVYRKQTGGIIAGPYIEGYYHAIYYNKNVAKKMGIKIKQYGMTFDDILRYIKMVWEYNQKQNTNIAAFYEAETWVTTEVLFQNLFKSEIKDFNKAKEEVSSEKKNIALLKTLQAFEKMGKYNPLIDSYKSAIFFQTRHLALDDKCLFFINGIWMYSHWMGIDKEKTKKMIPAELPVFQKVDYYLGGFIPTWAVMKDAPNKEEAIKLLMFWSRPQVAEKWVRYAKAPTGLVGHITTSDLADDPFERFQAKITDKYGSSIHYSANAGYIFGEENRFLQQDINKKLLLLLSGKITARQAYKKIMKKVK